MVFLAAFSVFNVILALASIHRASKLMTAAGRAWWASARLYGVAVFAAWTLPLVCLASVGFAWTLPGAALHWAAPIIVAPIAWLLGMGIFFALVDVAEDGVMDFGRGLNRRPKP